MGALRRPPRGSFRTTRLRKRHHGRDPRIVGASADSTYRATLSECLNLEDEHPRLAAQVKALQREHDELSTRGVNIAEHEEHKARLRDKIRELHAHLERLRQRR